MHNSKWIPTKMRPEQMKSIPTFDGYRINWNDNANERAIKSKARIEFNCNATCTHSISGWAIRLHWLFRSVLIQILLLIEYCGLEPQVHLICFVMSSELRVNGTRGRQLETVRLTCFASPFDAWSIGLVRLLIRRQWWVFALWICVCEHLHRKKLTKPSKRCIAHFLCLLHANDAIRLLCIQSAAQHKFMNTSADHRGSRHHHRIESRQRTTNWSGNCNTVRLLELLAVGIVIPTVVEPNVPVDAECHCFRRFS